METPSDRTAEEPSETARSPRRGATVRVRGRTAVFVKCWGTLGAVVRFDDQPHEPKVVPLVRIEPA